MDWTLRQKIKDSIEEMSNACHNSQWWEDEGIFQYLEPVLIEVDSIEEKLKVYQMTDNRLVIDYNTIKENLEMERACHAVEIKALEEKLKVAVEALELMKKYNCGCGKCASNDEVYLCYQCEALEKIKAK